jgi:ABC-type transport system substrate-binding protein
MVRNESYWEGAPNMDGMITRVVPDSGARLAQLLSGEIDITGLEPTQLTSVKATRTSPSSAPTTTATTTSA